MRKHLFILWYFMLMLKKNLLLNKANNEIDIKNLKKIIWGSHPDMLRSHSRLYIQ